LRGWLYAIAVRVASDYRRGVAQRLTAPLPEGVRDPGPDPQQRSELQDSVRLLHDVLEELPGELRTIFVLAELEELTVPEIAEALGANLNTVYSQKRAARLRFDAALKRRRARFGGRAVGALGAIGKWFELGPSLAVGAFKGATLVLCAVAAVHFVSAESQQGPESSRTGAPVRGSERASSVRAQRHRFEASASPLPSIRIPEATAPPQSSSRRLSVPTARASAAAARAPTARAELDALAEAQALVRAGDGMAALGALDAHAEDPRFSGERRTLRVLAWCAAGRIAEARREAAELLRSEPTSIQRNAVARSCAGELAEGDR
jgi:hypothetical protein